MWEYTVRMCKSCMNPFIYELSNHSRDEVRLSVAGTPATAKVIYQPRVTIMDE
jgi:hypothetical protein